MMTNRVTALRRTKNLTQHDLSRLSNVGRSTISNIETSRYVPRVDVAIRVSHALGVTVEEVFFI